MEHLNLIILFVAFVLFTGYIIGILSKHGVLKSILVSDNWLKKPWRLMFEITMWVSGAAIMLIAILIYKGVAWTLLGGGFGIFMVGWFPLANSNKEWYQLVHKIFAIGGFAACILAPWIDFNLMWFSLLPIISIPIIYYLYRKEFWIWYLEVHLGYEIFIVIFVLIMYLNR